ncbi:hypothetical protein B6S44_14825 [Bosea sp. Tri-44]|uniref:hypothetical protein n=1 Tax=Bosea sp. Tri-44 TaxID=1972137 RepID=UPI0010100438|nr:hypothetical protein [Bosea sp. Tri-44]RXT54871.1 hypothetical protein B6S44_14825 [Bosea sp. Tri-44]
MAIIFPEFEYPSHLQQLDMEIASMIKEAHASEQAVELLELATKIRRHITEDLRHLEVELSPPTPIYPRPKSMTPREWLDRFRAEGGVLPKPRITITAAMQDSSQM